MKKIILFCLSIIFGLLMIGCPNEQTSADDTEVTNTPPSGPQIITYTIKFDGNGGTGEMNPITLKAGEEKTLPSNTFASPTDMKFDGWNDKADGTGTCFENGASVRDLTTDNGIVITLYAQWLDKDSYHIIYHNIKTATNTNPKVFSSKDAFSLQGITAVGYDFNGWHTAEIDGEAISNWNAGTYTDTVELWAYWIPHQYSISLNNDGDTSGDTSITATFGENLPKISIPSKAGYIFSGYWFDNNGTSLQYINETGKGSKEWDIPSNTTLYVKWSPIQYKVAFDKNGGKGKMTTKTLKTDEEWNIKANSFTRVGYTFANWNTKANNTGTSYNNEELVKNLTNSNGKTITLYAQWMPIQYTIKFASNGGTGEMTEKTFTYNQVDTLTANSFEAPETGKVFAYWSDKQDGTGNPYLDTESILNITTTPNDEITLYAQWGNEGEYRIIYTDPINATNDNPVVYTDDSNIVLHDLSCNDWTFLGWYNSSNSVAVENKVTGWTAGTQQGTVLLWAKWAEGAASKTPGDVEPLPDAVNVLRQARQLINPLENEIVFFYWRDDGKYDTWSMWMWSLAEGGKGENNFDAITEHGFSVINVDNTADPSKPHKVGYMKFNTEGTAVNDCIPLTGPELEEIQNKGRFNFIVRKKSGWTKDYNGDLYWELMEGNCFGQLSGFGDVYSIADDAKPQIMNAVLKDNNHLIVGLSQRYAVSLLPSANGFSIESDNGDTITITDVYAKNAYGKENLDQLRSNNYQKQFMITLGTDIDYSKTWYVKHSKYGPDAGYKISLTSALKTNVSEMSYEGTDLGLTLNGSTAGFKVFAPMATTVNLLLYSDWNDAKSDIKNTSGTQTTSDSLTNGTRIAMTKASDFDETGIWEAKNIDVSGKNYYLYELNNMNTVYRVCDINALVVAPDSVAAQIIDINDSVCQPTSWETSYTNPFGNSGSETMSYTDAVIFEMHIRDWSKGLDSDNLGKFDEITAGLGTNGDGVLGQHLKDLGITHVQILPMFDYAELNSDSDYNWGYNPYHYNVPEGRYTNNHDNGGQEAVKQMRGMIKAFHDAGIAVNMDVVYNHTNGTKTGSLYDMTVPTYYYRMSTNGEYSNGSGCGNETDSSMPMFHKYMIDSLSHWMRDYHINGFRFDLMGLHESETMEIIYDELSQIDKNVMVYGEPWTGGSSTVKNGAIKAGVVGNAGYATFDDNFRNAIKGGEFDGFEKGQVQGEFADSAIITGLKGGSSSRNATGVAGLSLHYVECHDNYTLFDKLDISILDGESKDDWKAYNTLTTEQQNALRAQNKLAAAFVFLSQGTPFMNGGQEFMRTKHGNENSYNKDAGDTDNAIDLSFKTTYADVYKVYKGLIKLRRTYDAFTNGKSVSAEKIEPGVTKYTVSGTNGSFCILFNATVETKTLDTTGYSKVIDVTNGNLDESTTLPKTVTVGATNFAILKK